MSLLTYAADTNTCNSQEYTNLLEQRRRAQNFNVPPPRYNNLANNPYTKRNPITGQLFTKWDLDMRRKAEILKYNNNNSSTKTNNLTKRQQWAQLVRGASSKTYSLAYVNSHPPPCPDTILYTSSTASDVPGPPIYLYEDPHVPYYNVINDAVNNAAYGIKTNTNQENPWETYANADVIAQPTGLFNSLSIQNAITPTYQFSVGIPFTISVETDVTKTENVPTHYVDPSAIQVWVSRISLLVYYSQSQVTTLQPIYNGKNVYYKSASNAVNISADVSFNYDSQHISAYQYGGIFQCDNIVLQTQPGYIYDMQLKVDFGYTTSDQFATLFPNSTISVSAILNTTFATTQQPSTNCSVTNPVPVTQDTLPIFTLS